MSRTQPSSLTWSSWLLRQTSSSVTVCGSFSTRQCSKNSLRESTRCQWVSWRDLRPFASATRMRSSTSPTQPRSRRWSFNCSCLIFTQASIKIQSSTKSAILVCSWLVIKSRVRKKSNLRECLKCKRSSRSMADLIMHRNSWVTLNHLIRGLSKRDWQKT